MDIHLDQVIKTFQTFRAVRGVSLEIKSGELVALLGPSGSGKTTILRMIAGLEYPDGGKILFGDKDATNIPVRDRGVGFVFQNYALFPHMTVAENIGFGIKVSRSRRRPKGDIDRRVGELLDRMKLDGLGDRFPGQISGGQRQRVALARALAVDPAVLLLDEPFGALDANVRRELRRWLREIHDELHITTLFVTHDQEEALDLADRVVILSEGSVVQEGTPAEVSRRPNSRFVMTFLGDTNHLPATVKEGVADVRGLAVPAPEAKDGPAEFIARPRDLAWDSEGPGIPARIVHIIDRPDGRRLAVTTDRRESLELDVPPELQGKSGEQGFVKIRRGQVFSQS